MSGKLKDMAAFPRPPKRKPKSTNLSDPITLKAAPISSRKQEQISICLERDVAFSKSNGFEKYELEHQALPELSLSGIDPSTTFMGKKFQVPFFIEPLTGGSPGTERINRNLARAAEEMGIGMGLGSQRAMLEGPELTYTYQVRDIAPHIFLLGNIGATQLANYGIAEMIAMIRRVQADGLAIHLNPAQEICQTEGDTDWSAVLPQIARLCKDAPFPVVVKETGCGMTGEIAKKLEDAGASCLDIAGAGGTSMTKMEYHRGSKMAEPFLDWGIPTAESLEQTRRVVKIPLIASGGIRTGLDCAKALAMGASLVGFACPMLKPAMKSPQAVILKVTALRGELMRAMLLVGAKNIPELQRKKFHKRF
jgi:isopentenyl-diphosphate Delta-isomerase